MRSELEAAAIAILDLYADRRIEARSLLDMGEVNAAMMDLQRALQLWLEESLVATYDYRGR